MTNPVPDGEDSSVDPVTPDGEVEESLVSGPAIREETLLLEKAIGGWRGVFDSAAPSLVYIAVYLPTKHLVWAVIAAVATGLLIAAWRVSAKRSTLQILGGLGGVAVSAIVTLTTHQARGYFLFGMILNVVYGSVFLVSVLIGRPVLGYLFGGLTGDFTSWLRDKQVRRTYAAATWIWVFVFAIRLAIRVPLYLANAVGWLGVTGVILGWPLYLLAAWFTYLLVGPGMRQRREAMQASGEPTSGTTATSETPISDTSDESTTD